jgi:two-component system, NtrC family, response regulator AtoC
VSARILVVDDDRAFRLSTAALLRADGYEVDAVGDATAAAAALKSGGIDLVLLDLRMPGTDGITLVEALRVWGEGVAILMISGYGTVDAAVRALHAGADDFLTKPVEPAVLSARVRELLERRPSPAAVAAAAHGLVGRSPAMRELFTALHQVAPTDTTVLITGETGTGKELVAAAVHEFSKRRHKPWLTINCAALAPGLLETELFGHVRGAFSGAIRDKVGLFEAAGDGTVFLDEIGDVPPPLQLRLLRVLQEREITRVGDVRARKVDVRIVAATNRDLRALVREGMFREDLFYRVHVFPIRVPALRDRPGDIPLLATAALARLGASATGISALAMRLLRAYPWPGNVRELFAAIESASIRAGGARIDAQHLSEEIRGAGIDERDARARYRASDDAAGEREAIRAALELTDGVVSRAAELLGMGRTTLWRKMKTHDLGAT